MSAGSNGNGNGLIGWMQKNVSWLITIGALLITLGVTWGSVLTQAGNHYDDCSIHHTLDALDKRYATAATVTEMKGEVKGMSDKLDTMNIRLERLCERMGVQ